MTDKPMFPSKREQLKNLVSSARDVVKDPRFCTRDEQQARLQICEECKFYHKARCTKCGCGLNGKVKFKAAKCPIGKW